MTAMTIPTTAAELEDMLGDSKVMASLFAEGVTADEKKEKAAARREFLTNYARVTNGRDASISTQIREETQRVFAEMMRDNGMADIKRPDLSPVDDAGMPKGLPNYRLYNKHAKGASLDKVFDGLGDYLKAVYKDGKRYPNADRVAQLQNAFGSEVPADGGFLVPEILRANLIKVALETAIMRPRAMVIPMDSPRVPFPAVDSTTNVGSVYGGVTTYWVEEGAAFTPSSASFGRVLLDAKKLIAYAEVPNELIADSIIAFEAFISQTFPEALAFAEDVKFLVGNGAGEPLGALNAPAAVSVAKEAGQPTQTILIENVVKMYARMLPSSLNRAIWVASIDTFPQLATMALSVGTGGAPVWLAGGSPVGGATAAPPVSIFGRPVYFTEKANVLGTQGDINFIDPSFYMIGDRQMMTAADSQDYKFANDLTAFRFTQRLDGRPSLLNSITPANGGPNLSAFVNLATR